MQAVNMREGRPFSHAVNYDFVRWVRGLQGNKKEELQRVVSPRVIGRSSAKACLKRLQQGTFVRLERLDQATIDAASHGVYVVPPAEAAEAAQAAVQADRASPPPQKPCPRSRKRSSQSMDRSMEQPEAKRCKPSSVDDDEVLLVEPAVRRPMQVIEVINIASPSPASPAVPVVADEPSMEPAAAPSQPLEEAPAPPLAAAAVPSTVHAPAASPSVAAVPAALPSAPSVSAAPPVPAAPLPSAAPTPVASVAAVVAPPAATQRPAAPQAAPLYAPLAGAQPTPTSGTALQIGTRPKLVSISGQRSSSMVQVASPISGEPPVSVSAMPSAAVVQEMLHEMARCVRDTEMEFIRLDKELKLFDQMPTSEKNVHIVQALLDSTNRLAMKAAAVKACIDRDVAKSYGRRFYPALLAIVQQDSRLKLYSTVRLMTVVSLLIQLSNTNADPNVVINSFAARAFQVEKRKSSPSSQRAVPPPPRPQPQLPQQEQPRVPSQSRVPPPSQREQAGVATQQQSRVQPQQHQVSQREQLVVPALMQSRVQPQQHQVSQREQPVVPAQLQSRVQPQQHQVSQREQPVVPALMQSTVQPQQHQVSQREQPGVPAQQQSLVPQSHLSRVPQPVASSNPRLVFPTQPSQPASSQQPFQQQRVEIRLTQPAQPAQPNQMVPVREDISLRGLLMSQKATMSSALQQPQQVVQLPPLQIQPQERQMMVQQQQAPVLVPFGNQQPNGNSNQIVTGVAPGAPNVTYYQVQNQLFVSNPNPTPGVQANALVSATATLSYQPCAYPTMAPSTVQGQMAYPNVQTQTQSLQLTASSTLQQPFAQPQQAQPQVFGAYTNQAGLRVVQAYPAQQQLLRQTHQTTMQQPMQQAMLQPMQQQVYQGLPGVAAVQMSGYTGISAEHQTSSGPVLVSQMSPVARASSRDSGISTPDDYQKDAYEEQNRIYQHRRAM